MTATTGELLRAARTRAGLSPRAVAVRSGVGQSALWMWENSRRDPQVSTLLRVAKGLDVEPAALLPAAEDLPPSSRGHLMRALRRLPADPEGLTRAGLEVIISLARDDLRAALSAEEQAP